MTATDTSEKTERVRTRAYRIWETEGRPHGRDQAHWYQAEAEMSAVPRAQAESARAPVARAGKGRTARRPAARKRIAAPTKN